MSESVPWYSRPELIFLWVFMGVALLFLCICTVFSTNPVYLCYRVGRCSFDCFANCCCRRNRNPPKNPDEDILDDEDYNALNESNSFYNMNNMNNVNYRNRERKQKIIARVFLQHLKAKSNNIPSLFCTEESERDFV